MTPEEQTIAEEEAFRRFCERVGSYFNAASEYFIYETTSFEDSKETLKQIAKTIGDYLTECNTNISYLKRRNQNARNACSDARREANP